MTETLPRSSSAAYSRPLRILHIGNGEAYKVRAIVEAFRDRGHHMYMVPIPPTGAPCAGVSWHPLPVASALGRAKVPIRLFAVRQLVKAIAPDIVHAHNAWGPGWYGAATGHHPYVIQAYGGDLLPEQYADRPSWQRHLTAHACRAADRVVVTGQHMIDASKGLGIGRERLLLLSRGVDLERYRPGLDTSALRHRLGIPETAYVVLSPRYQVNERLYNLDVVVRAIACLVKTLPETLCLQLYDPRQEDGRNALAKTADKLNLGHAYRLIPCLDNAEMPLLYNLAHVVVSVPSSDGFPVTVLEASACGVPIVVGRLPFCDEWFVDLENGIVVPVGDAEAVAQAIVRLRADDQWRMRMGARARQMAEERADSKRSIDVMEIEYRRLLERDRCTTRG